MISTIHSATFLDLRPTLVDVEVEVNARGLPFTTIVGMAEKSVVESRHRVKSALFASDFPFPSKKTTINLVPSEISKHGTLFDLPIAVGIAQQHFHFSADLDTSLFLGELHLDGTLHENSTLLPFVWFANQHEFTDIFLPPGTILHERLQVRVRTATTLKEVLLHIQGKITLPILKPTPLPTSTPFVPYVVGQAFAARAMEIAVAGGHHLFLQGPAGTGKTSLAQAWQYIAPPLSAQELQEAVTIHAALHSTIDGLSKGLRPFRCPHHRLRACRLYKPPISGQKPRADEVTLARHGCLFLDEFHLFPTETLQALRELMESNPTERQKDHFQVIAASNPCPCGNTHSELQTCTCTPAQLRAYAKKIPEPVLDRFDLIVHLYRSLHSDDKPIDFEQMRQHILHARKQQKLRFKTDQLLNGSLSSAEITQFCVMTESAQNMLNNIETQLRWSPRRRFHTIRVAQTIADLVSSEKIAPEHIAEAIQLRQETPSQ